MAEWSYGAVVQVKCELINVFALSWLSLKKFYVFKGQQRKKIYCIFHREEQNGSYIYIYIYVYIWYIA